MQISPTVIRKKSFDTSFRGFDKEQVETFLKKISQAYGEISQENLELKSKLQLVQSDAKRLKDVEASLFRTLKTAEDTGAEIIQEANDAADRIIEEANESARTANEYAEKIIEEAKRKASSDASLIIEAAEKKAEKIILDFKEKMNSLIQDYKKLLDQRELLRNDLKIISENISKGLQESNSQLEKTDVSILNDILEKLDVKDFTLEKIQRKELGDNAQLDGEMATNSSEDNQFDSEEELPEKNAQTPKESDSDDESSSDGLEKLEEESSESDLVDTKVDFEDFSQKTNNKDQAKGSFFDQFD